MSSQAKAVTRVLVVCLLAASAFASLSTAQQTAPPTSPALNNRDIIQMTRAQFDDATIIKTIRAFHTDLDVSVQGLLQLKQAGVTQPVIQAMLNKSTDAPPPDAPRPVLSSDASAYATPAAPESRTAPSPPSPRPTAVVAQPEEESIHHPYSQPAVASAPVNASNRNDPDRFAKQPLPRVYLESASHGSNRNAARDQSMEMGKDFLKVCNVIITINQNNANYTIRLNHIEHGLLYRDNQLEVYDQNGDLMRNKEGGSIKKNVQQACAMIRSDWSIRSAN